MSKKTFDLVVQPIVGYLEHLAFRNDWLNEIYNGGQIITEDKTIKCNIQDKAASITIYGSQLIHKIVRQPYTAYVIIKLARHEYAFYVERFEVQIPGISYLSGSAFLLFKGKLSADERHPTNTELSDYWKVDCPANVDAMFHEYDKVASFYGLPQIFFPMEKANI